MKSFKQFKSQINELFDQPARYRSNYKTKQGRSQYTYEADIDGKNLKMVVDQTLESKTFDGRIREGYWEITFWVDDEISATDSEGREIKVFSTVLAMIDDFIKKENPSRVRYASKLNEPSRISLYNRLTKVLGKKYGFKLEQKKKMIKTVIYILSR